MTSQSSTGPGPNVALIPPWADDLPPDQDGHEPADGAPIANNPPDTPDLAPPNRFGTARRQLGLFMQGEGASYLRSGVGRYVATGYGGSRTLAGRMASTGSTAQRLSSALNPNAANAVLDRVFLAGRTVDEVLDAVVEAVQPHDGTQDAESSRESIREAMVDLLDEHPDVDLLDLTETQREFVLEKYAANDVFRRFELDMGKQMLEKATTPAMALKRMQEAKDYISAVIAQSFQDLADQGLRPTAGSVRSVVMAALEESFRVFEGYIQ